MKIRGHKGIYLYFYYFHTTYNTNIPINVIINYFKDLFLKGPQKSMLVPTDDRGSKMCKNMTQTVLEWVSIQTCSNTSESLVRYILLKSVLVLGVGSIVSGISRDAPVPVLSISFKFFFFLDTVKRGLARSTRDLVCLHHDPESAVHTCMHPVC